MTSTAALRHAVHHDSNAIMDMHVTLDAKAWNDLKLSFKAELVRHIGCVKCKVALVLMLTYAVDMSMLHALPDIQ